MTNRKPVRNVREAALAAAQRDQKRQRRALWGLVRSLLLFGGMIAAGALLYVRQLPPVIDSITTAHALDAVYSPIDPTERFGPDDTFYVSIEFQRYNGNYPLQARWSYEGQVIDTTTLSIIDPGAGSGQGGFELVNNAPPWPIGTYTVDILFGQTEIGSTTFTVQ